MTWKRKTGPSGTTLKEKKQKTVREGGGDNIGSQSREGEIGKIRIASEQRKNGKCDITKGNEVSPGARVGCGNRKITLSTIIGSKENWPSRGKGKNTLNA